MTPEPSEPAAGSQRLLIVTNNRFWRGSIGSHARVAAVHRHFADTGWDITVAFCGRPSASDEADIKARQLHVVFSLQAEAAATENETLPASRAGAAQDAPRRRWREHALSASKRALRWLRAAATQPARALHGRAAAGAQGGWREIALRANASRVTDGIDPRYAQLARELSSTAPPDVVLVEYVVLAWVLPLLKPHLPAHTRWLLDTHDVMYERQQRFHALGEVHTLDITAHEEARWLSLFDVVLAIQPRDAEKFRAIGVRSQVLTLLHPQAATLVASATRGVVGIGFLGSEMTPNTRAAHELLRDVWPRVRSAVGGGAALVIAGAVCGQLQGAAQQPGVQLLGHIDTLDDFYCRVDIVASPIRIGGGLKIKNVEALCKGKALVTTAIGAEGLEDAAGSGYWLVDTVDATVDALVELVRDATARQALAARGYAYAQATFDETAVFRELDALLASFRRPVPPPVVR